MPNDTWSSIKVLFLGLFNDASQWHHCLSDIYDIKWEIILSGGLERMLKEVFMASF